MEPQDVTRVISCWICAWSVVVYVVVSSWASHHCDLVGPCGLWAGQAVWDTQEPRKKKRKEKGGTKEPAL